MHYWILSGPQEHWDIGLRHSVWGVKPGSQQAKQSWLKMKVGDIVFFYATKPIKGLIGFGIVKNTNTSSVPIWDTKELDHDYGCRIIFYKVFTVFEDHTKTPISLIKIKPQVAAALNEVTGEKKRLIINEIHSKWGKRMPDLLWRKTINFQNHRVVKYLYSFFLIFLGWLLNQIFDYIFTVY